MKSEKLMMTMYLKFPGILFQLKCFGLSVNSNGSSITNPFLRTKLFGTSNEISD
jgi:hypothetical protein